MIKPLFAYGLRWRRRSACRPRRCWRRSCARLRCARRFAWRLGRALNGASGNSKSSRADRDAALVRAERTPQLFAGSGLGYTDGIPQSIAGAAPSIAQVTAMQPLFDAGRKQRIRQARQLSVAAAHSAEAKRANARPPGRRPLFGHGARSAQHRASGAATRPFPPHRRRQRGARRRRTRNPRGADPRRLDGARAAERLRAAQAQFDLLEADLRRRLDLEPDVRLRPVADDSLQPVDLPGDRAEAQRAPSKTIPTSQLSKPGSAPRTFSGRPLPAAVTPSSISSRSTPLLAKFNNYDEFFNRFQSHNWQAGISFQVPLFAGKGVGRTRGQSQAGSPRSRNPTQGQAGRHRTRKPARV